MKKIALLILSSLLAFSYTSYDTALEVDDGDGVTEPVVEEMFIHEDQIAYTTVNTYAKDSPYEDGQDVLFIGSYTELSLTGTNNCDYWEITVDEEIYYINNDDITILTEEYTEVELAAFIAEETYAKDSPSEDGEDMIALEQYSTVALTGISASDYWRISIDEEVYYINKEDMYILTDNYTAVEMTAFIMAATYAKDSPSEDGEDVVSLKQCSTADLTGISTSDYWQITIDEEVYYINKEDMIILSDNYTAVKQTGYVIANTYGKDSPDGSNSKYLPKYTTITVTGINNSDYWQIEYSGKTYYVDVDDITIDKSVFNALAAKTYNTSWSGKKLTKKAGRITGPSGEETYYNLDMSKVVAYMRKLGNTDAYWVRSDGCKMLGDYIIVAANLDVHPRGSLVETSLGTGIVCDTGGFASTNTTQIDIATNW